MSVQEEKEWLRALLEGKIKPGDAAWERVCLDADFAGLRRRLREIDRMHPEHREADL